MIRDEDLVLVDADPLQVVEMVMRYFYALGVQGRKAKAPVEDVQKCFQKALYAASLAAPYRHARLSAVKHIDPADELGISANAMVENCGQNWPSVLRFSGIGAWWIWRHCRRRSEWSAHDLGRVSGAYSATAAQSLSVPNSAQPPTESVSHFAVSCK